MTPGSRQWLALSDPATWRLGHDRALQRQILAARAATRGARLTFHRDGLRLDARPVCYECGRDPDEPARDCEAHGVEVTYEETLPAAVVLGVDRPSVLGTRADLERLGLVEGQERAA